MLLDVSVGWRGPRTLPAGNEGRIGCPRSVSTIPGPRRDYPRAGQCHVGRTHRPDLMAARHRPRSRARGRVHDLRRRPGDPAADLPDDPATAQPATSHRRPPTHRARARAPRPSRHSLAPRRTRRSRRSTGRWRGLGLHRVPPSQLERRDLPGRLVQRPRLRPTPRARTVARATPRPRDAPAPRAADAGAVRGDGGRAAGVPVAAGAAVPGRSSATGTPSTPALTLGARHSPTTRSSGAPTSGRWCAPAPRGCPTSTGSAVRMPQVLLRHRRVRTPGVVRELPQPGQRLRGRRPLAGRGGADRGRAWPDGSGDEASPWCSPAT